MSIPLESILERGRLARKEGRLEDALSSYHEAIFRCRAEGNRLLLIHALKGLGQIERDLGETEKALPCLEEAVALCREHAIELLGHALRHLGDVHQDMSNLALAEPCYLEALELYRESYSTPVLELANALRPLALLNEKQGKRSQAAAYWTEARTLYAAVRVQAGVDECDEYLKTGS